MILCYETAYNSFLKLQQKPMIYITHNINTNMQKLKNQNKYYVKIYWSDENNGDCENSFEIEAKDTNEVWKYIFEEYYNKDQKLEDHGGFIDADMFSFDLYWSESKQLMVFYDELSENDFKYNEDGELETYCMTYTINVYED